MPYFESTEILKAIAKAEGSFGDAEFREGSNAASRLLFSNEATAFANLTQLKASEKQPTEMISQKRSSVATGTNKTAVHDGEFGDSFVQAITYLPISRNFNVSYEMAQNNQFGYQEQLNTQILNSMMDIRAGINDYAIAQLAALKTQVADSSTILTWDGTNFKYTNTSGDKDRAASYIKAAARKNKYGQTLDVIGGQILVADLIHNSAQGTSNDENLAYQFSGINLVEEEMIDEATLGANGYGYVLPSGLVGMTSWNEQKNLSGVGDAGNNEGLFTTINDPVIPGLMYDVHVIRGVADTAITSETYYQDVVDKYQVTAFYCFSHAMISTTDETPIFAFEQL